MFCVAFVVKKPQFKVIDLERKIVVYLKMKYELTFYNIFSGEKIYSLKILELIKHKVLSWNHITKSNFTVCSEFILNYFLDNFKIVRIDTIKIR